MHLSMTNPAGTASTVAAVVQASQSSPFLRQENLSFGSSSRAKVPGEPYHPGLPVSDLERLLGQPCMLHRQVVGASPSLTWRPPFRSAEADD